MASACLIPGPGMIRVEEYCLLKRKSQTGEVVQNMSFPLISLHMKGQLLGEMFAISKNWLALGGAASPQQVNQCNRSNTDYVKISVWLNMYI